MESFVLFIGRGIFLFFLEKCTNSHDDIGGNHMETQDQQLINADEI